MNRKLQTDRHAEGAAPLSWRIQEQPDSTIVEMFGEVDENADFAELKRRLRGKVILNLAEVRRLNSCGVREWVNFVRELPHVSELVFTHCSPAIVTQLNMIYNFRGGARVASFLAPYVCSSCHTEAEKLLEVNAHFPTRDPQCAPGMRCDACGGTMELDDVPERYLSFLAES